MKISFRIFLFAAAMMTCYETVYAQRNDDRRPTREELAEKQAKHIAGAMALEDAVAERFVETFCRCQQEIWALGPKIGSHPFRDAASETNEAAAGQEISARFERSQKILDIRRKYYEEYSGFLTQKQIEHVYELERRMIDRLARRSDIGHRRDR